MLWMGGGSKGGYSKLPGQLCIQDFNHFKATQCQNRDMHTCGIWSSNLIQFLGNTGMVSTLGLWD